MRNEGITARAAVPISYGYTGTGYESYINLLFLRARWYAAESGIFLSRDAMESEPPYAYVRGNPINLVDPFGLSSVNPSRLFSDCQDSKCKLELGSSVTLESAKVGLDFLPGYNTTGHLLLIHQDQLGFKRAVDMAPSIYPDWEGRVKSGNLKDTGLLKGFNPLLHPFDTDAGHLVVRYNENQRSIEENLSISTVMTTIIAEGQEICDKWKCLFNAMQQIEKNRIGYYMLGPNSNSAVYSALRFCNLQSEAVTGIMSFEVKGRAHPGADLYLLGWLTNLRPEIYQVDQTGLFTPPSCLQYPGSCGSTES